MADQNLTIGIRADASQLRADLALAQAQVRELGTALRNAANEAQKTGDTSAVKGLADSFEQARLRVSGLKGELAEVGGGAGKEAIASLAEEAGKLGGAFTLLGPALNVLTSGLGGLAAALGTVTIGMFELSKSAAESTRELENAATTLGLTVDQLEGYKFAFGQVGVSAETTEKALSRFVAKQNEAFESGKKANDIYQESANQAEKLRIEIKNLEIGVSTARQAQDTGRIATQQAADAMAKGKVTAAETALAYRDLATTGIAVGSGLNAVAEAQLKLQKGANDAKAATTAVSSEALKYTQSLQNQGIASEKLTLAQDALRLKQNEVIKTSTDNVNAFTKLGVAVANSDGSIRNTSETLDDFIEAVSKLKTAAEQSGPLKEIFGQRGFAAIAPGIRLGREELEKLRKEFEKFDVSPTAIESGLAKSFNAAFSKLTTVFDGLKQAVGNIFSTPFTNAMNAIAKSLADNRENVRAFAETLVSALGPAFALVGRVISGLLKPIGDLFEIMGKSTGTVTILAAVILSLTTRIGRIIAIIIAVDQALTAAFGDEATARIISWGVEIVAAVKVLGILYQAIMLINAAAAPWIALAAAIAAVGVLILALFGPVDEISKFLRKVFGEDAASYFDAFVKLVNDAAEALGRKFNEAAKAVLGFLEPVITKLGEIKDFISSVLNLAGSVAGAVAGASSGGGAAPGFAGGGDVRGPGGRDRVPIWATAGEFVHQLAAVRHYGLDFMRRLNRMEIPRFEFGGLVDMFNPVPQHFAMGGAVEAAVGGGKVVVDLRIGGERIGDLLAPRRVAEKLVTHARGEAMRSAGRLPTSMGGGSL